MTNRVWLKALLLVSISSSAANAQVEQDELVRTATSVLGEVMAIPAKRIPQSLLSNAHAVAIIPSMLKGGFVIGVRHGRGVLSIRGDDGQWLPPIFISLTGGSVGWQVGIQATDVILVFRTRQSVNNLKNGRITIGVDAAGAAGPVGRQASAATDATLSAEILSYSRSRGLFAGVSFDGSALQIDNTAGMGYYRRPIISANGQPLYRASELPTAAVNLMNRLAQYSGSAAAANHSADPAASIQAVRSQLVQSWQQLSTMLDERWMAFLALPGELATPGAAVNLESLNETMRRYTATAENPQYASLSQRPEFTKTYGLLRQLATLSAPNAASRMTLPPPPARSGEMRGGRY